MTKYFIYLNDNKLSKNIKYIGVHTNKKELFKYFKEKINFNYEKFKNSSIILLRIKKVKFNKKQKIKMVFGPIKVEIEFYHFTLRGAIKIKDRETRNNHLFYTEKYNKIKLKDLKKIVYLAINNKLEKRLLAPKLIDQIFNINI